MKKIKSKIWLNLEIWYLTAWWWSWLPWNLRLSFCSPLNWRLKLMKDLVQYSKGEEYQGLEHGSDTKWRNGREKKGTATSLWTGRAMNSVERKMWWYAVGRKKMMGGDSIPDLWMMSGENKIGGGSILNAKRLGTVPTTDAPTTCPFFICFSIAILSSESIDRFRPFQHFKAFNF